MQSIRFFVTHILRNENRGGGRLLGGCGFWGATDFEATLSIGYPFAGMNKLYSARFIRIKVHPTHSMVDGHKTGLTDCTSGTLQ
jgi:hypothetical protein